MITLPQMDKDLSFQEDGHIYTVGTMIIPSVTQIIKPLSDFSMINKDILQYASDRGTAVHFAIEKYLKYGYVSKLDSDAQPYFEQFLEWFKGFDRENFACEIMVANREYNYCGTIDIIFQDSQGRYSIIDIKTSSVATPKTWAVQLSGYAMACYKYGIRIDEIRVLQLSPTSCKIHVLQKQEGIFLSCLNIHNYINTK